MSNNKYKKYLIDNGLIIYAFRYALNRHTYATTDVIRVIRDLWNELPVNYQKLILKEIELHLEFSDKSAFTELDDKEWAKLLRLSVKGE